jgi:ribosome biogenesis GTPase
VHNRVSVLAGPSGAGKSSLLNALNPDLQLRVGEVSGKIERGQHTTRHVELLQLQEADSETLIADTPGFSNLKFNTVLPRQLESIFRDFAPFREQCAFSDCLHTAETDPDTGKLRDEGCAVLANLSDISETRYRSYLAMLAEARTYKEESQVTSQKQEYGYKEVSKKGRDAVKILRLKERNRDLSRRTQRQQVDLMHAEEDGADLDDFLVDEPTDPV